MRDRLETPRALLPSVGVLERAGFLVAALLVGLGVIMWVAGNWDGLGRYGRFGVTALALAGAIAGALLMPRLRAPFLLVAHLAIGALLALIGQTYQTGADPWSLFAIWAGLSLPFVIAARSDAVWSAWIIVALAGVAMWSRNQGQALFGFHAGPQGALLAWAAIIGICLPVSPWSPLRALMGTTRWSWRIGVALALTQIVLPAMAGLWSEGHLVVFLAGFALCGGLLMLVAARQPFDLVVAALLGVAIDVLLVAGLIRVVFSGGGGDLIGSTLIVGLASAGIVAATATWLLRHYREQTATPAAAEEPQKLSDEPQESVIPPWPILALTAFGALLAAIPLLFFYALLLMQVVGDSALTGPLIPILGALTLGAAVMLLRDSKRGLFANVLALIFALVGGAQIGFGAFRDLAPAMAALGLLAMLILLAVLVPQHWIRLLCGLPASKLLGLAAATLFWSGTPSPWMVLTVPGAFSTSLVVESLACVVIVALLVRPPSRLVKLAPFLIGWIAGMLLGSAAESGPTLLAGAFGSGVASGGLGGPGGGAVAMATRVTQIGVAMLGLIWLWRQRPEWRRPVLMALGLGLTALAALVPVLAVPVFVGLVMLAEGRRGLSLLAGAVGLWIIGAFYYSLALPLVTKGLLLIGIGSVLLGLAAVMGRGRWPSSDGMSAVEGPARDPVAGSGMRGAQALIGAGAICVLGLCGWSILSKEHVLRTGRMVLLRIVPVDPRSLVQGDYMTLAFDLPQRRPSADERDWSGPQPVAIGRVGGDNVVTLTEIVAKRPPLMPDGIAIALSLKNRNFVVGSDAWFFKEGTADKWAGARYGIFRVTGDGTALLAGLADEARRPIQ